MINFYLCLVFLYSNFFNSGVTAHLFWLQINQIDCHRINRYNDISIEKEKVPEHLVFAETSVPEPWFIS